MGFFRGFLPPGPKRGVQRYSFICLSALFIGLAAFSSMPAHSAEPAPAPVKIGVLAFRAKPQTLAQWQPLAVALKQAIPNRDFVIEALAYPELDEAVARHQVDFVLTNPGHYVLLAKRSGLSAPLATLAADDNGQPSSQFGGVIFSRAGQTGINTLRDLNGKTVAAVSTESFGGYQMQAYELSRIGIFLPQNVHPLLTGMPHDNVVRAVLSGRADVGFVRTGVLEAMAREGQLKMRQIKVINLQHQAKYPVLLSTMLYPEWAFAALPKISEELARQVTAALFGLEKNSAVIQAIGIHGFVIPADYLPVSEVLEALRLPPYDMEPSFTLNDIWLRYLWQIIGASIAALLIVLLAVRLLFTRRTLGIAHQVVLAQKQELQSLLDSMDEGAYGVDTHGNCTFVNKSFLRILGYASPDEIVGRFIHKLIHYAHADGSHYPSAECKMYSVLHASNHQGITCSSDVFWRKDGISIAVEYRSQPILRKGIVTGAISTFIDITERKQHQHDVEQLAFYDPLTRLPNRRLLMDRLQHALSANPRNDRHGAVLFIDLDNFKTLNDTQGHAAGDLLLIEVARRLKACVREEDTVARLGGDEFVLLLDNLGDSHETAGAHAARVAHKILQELNRPYALNGYGHDSSPSIGVVLFYDRSSSADELLQHADSAMYQSKNAGRNTVRFYDEQTQAALLARSELERALRHALDRQQLALHYQLQVNADYQPIGAEVLLRWQHPKLGTVSPVQFIPLAEETGMIVPIGYWVLQTACAQLKLWQNDPLTRDLVLAVNVSVRQFREADFIEKVQLIVKQSGIRPGCLKLEITESMLAENVEAIISTMLQLKALGLKFSMDDFGTGYSSLSSIKRLPLDQLKIDQSFVRDILQDEHDKAIVRTIIAMAQSMALDIIAEGVETKQQRDLLAIKGCTNYQGYLFGRPVPLEEFEALLGSTTR